MRLGMAEGEEEGPGRHEKGVGSGPAVGAVDTGWLRAWTGARTQGLQDMCWALGRVGLG